ASTTKPESRRTPVLDRRSRRHRCLPRSQLPPLPRHTGDSKSVEPNTSQIASNWQLNFGVAPNTQQATQFPWRRTHPRKRIISQYPTPVPVCSTTSVTFLRRIRQCSSCFIPPASTDPLTRTKCPSRIFGETTCPLADWHCVAGVSTSPTAFELIEYRASS